MTELVAGILTNSLALLADAGHMVSDAGALSLSLGALWLASRPPTARRTYGFHRAEVLAAFLNSLLLVLIAIYIFWEASKRFSNAPEVESGPMLGVAVVGLAANVASAAILFRQSRHSLNVRAALLHTAGDALGSVGAITAAIIMLTTGEFIADPAISALIGVLVLVSAFGIAWESTHVLMEGTPEGVSVPHIQDALAALPGVTGLHDLHVWTVTSGFLSLSVHVETDQVRDPHDILVDARRLLAQRFRIEHATIQLETASLHQELESCCGPETEEVTTRHAAHHR